MDYTEIFTRQFEVNLGSTRWITQVVAPHLQKQDCGVIAHTSVRQGLDPSRARTDPYRAVMPPSATITCPLMNEASSEARKDATVPISSGRPQRCSGTRSLSRT